MAAPKAGGFKLSLASAKGKPGFKAPTANPAKRPRLNLGEDEAEDDSKKQEITGWDAAAGGAVELNGKEEDKGPRIIPALPNRNWRDEAMKRKLAQAGGRTQQNGSVPVKMEEPKVTYGLNIIKKETKEGGSPEPMDTTEEEKPKDEDDGLTEEQRLEKNALDVLIHGKATELAVIPIQSEDDAFQNDMRDAPDAPTLAAYEATPIEGFGAALLRGMGWRDGDEIGHGKKPAEKPKEIKRRPALLGIGAKEEAAVGIELGEWGKGKKKAVMNYNPVTLKNKRTGEMISEEDLKARMEAQKLMPDEKLARSSRHEDEDDEQRRREKRKDRKERDRRDDDYDSERRRDKDRRRDREDEYSDRREKKEYRGDDYDDSDSRREKRRDRDRRDESRGRDDYERRDKGRDRDRERRHRSRSPNGEDRREKRRERDRRDRDRSRSRGSEDRRKRRREYDDEERDERKRRHRDRDDKYYRK